MMISIPSGILSYFIAATELLNNYAPFSYAFIVFISIWVGYFYINNRKIKKNIEILVEKSNNQNLSFSESSIEFEFKDGFVPIKNQNAMLVHVLANTVNGSKTGCIKTIFTLFIIFENKVDYSCLTVNPQTQWTKIDFNNKYALISMCDVKSGIYKIEFK